LLLSVLAALLIVLDFYYYYFGFTLIFGFYYSALAFSITIYLVTLLSSCFCGADIFLFEALEVLDFESWFLLGSVDEASIKLSIFGIGRSSY